MAGGPTRSDTARVTVSIEHPVSGNMINYGVFDKFDGGGWDSEELTYRAGGMAPTESLGGAETFENVTVQRLYRLERDHSVIGQMRASRGRCAMIVSRQPLDIKGSPYGDPTVYRGTLKRVTPPPHDSMTNEGAMLELEMTVASVG